MHRVQGVVKHYDWGDSRFLPELLGETPDSKPWAEVWFGTYRDGHASVGGSGEPLANVAGELRYMVKFLSAAKPLSLQVHPSKDQAVAGFARENAAGVPLTSPQRIYRDESDKPELLIALSSFTALCGFHSSSSTVGWFRAMKWDALADYLEANGIQAFVTEALTGNAIEIPAFLPPWAQKLSECYPGDRALLVALLMHHVELAPGECLLLEAGTLHAYLQGNAVEVMNDSNNVVRAGFTTKHIDPNEVLRIASFEASPTPVRRPEFINRSSVRYPSTGAFSVEMVQAPGTVEALPQPQLVVCTNGSSDGFHQGQVGLLQTGESLNLTGDARVFVATAGTQR